MGYTKYIVKNDNFEVLKDFGFIQSKVANFPIKLMKVVNVEDKHIIEVCNDPKRSYNMWSGQDWKQVGILQLWSCKRLDVNYTWSDGEKSPYYECDGTVSGIRDYILDLIEADLIEEIEVK